MKHVTGEAPLHGIQTSPWRSALSASWPKKGSTTRTSSSAGPRDSTGYRRPCSGTHRRSRTAHLGAGRHSAGARASVRGQPAGGDRVGQRPRRHREQLPVGPRAVDPARPLRQSVVAGRRVPVGSPTGGARDLARAERTGRRFAGAACQAPRRRGRDPADVLLGPAAEDDRGHPHRRAVPHRGAQHPRGRDPARTARRSSGPS